MATKTEELPDSGDHDTAPDSSSAEQQPAVDPEIGNPARQEAEALLESLRPEVREELGKVASKVPRRRGAKPGPRYDYTPHLTRMAELIVQAEISGDKLSVRQAAKLASEWADEKDVASVSFQTLRKYFREDRKRELLARVRERLTSEHGKEESEPASEERKTGGHPGVEATGVPPSPATSPPAGPGVHLEGFAGRHNLDSTTLASLSKPDVFKEICMLTTLERVQEHDALRSDLRLSEPIRTGTEEFKELLKSATRSSRPVDTSGAKDLDEDPNEKMDKFFKSSKPPKSSWEQ